MSQLLRENQENRDIKHPMVICSGFNTDYKSSEPLETLVMLCYVMLCYVDVNNDKRQFL